MLYIDLLNKCLRCKQRKNGISVKEICKEDRNDYGDLTMVLKERFIKRIVNKRAQMFDGLVRFSINR